MNPQVTFWFPAMISYLLAVTAEEGCHDKRMDELQDEIGRHMTLTTVRVRRCLECSHCSLFNRSFYIVFRVREQQYGATADADRVIGEGYEATSRTCSLGNQRQPQEMLGLDYCEKFPHCRPPPDPWSASSSTSGRFQGHRRQARLRVHAHSRWRCRRGPQPASVWQRSWL